MKRIQRNLQDGRLELENSVLGVEKSTRKDLQSLFKNEAVIKGGKPNEKNESGCIEAKKNGKKNTKLRMHVNLNLNCFIFQKMNFQRV